MVSVSDCSTMPSQPLPWRAPLLRERAYVQCVRVSKMESEAVQALR